MSSLCAILPRIITSSRSSAWASASSRVSPSLQRLARLGKLTMNPPSAAGIESTGHCRKCYHGQRNVGCAMMCLIIAEPNFPIVPHALMLARGGIG